MLVLQDLYAVYGVRISPVRPLAKRGREKAEIRTATQGVSTLIAVDGAGADRSAEERRPPVYDVLACDMPPNSAGRLLYTW